MDDCAAYLEPVQSWVDQIRDAPKQGRQHLSRQPSGGSLSFLLHDWLGLTLILRRASMNVPQDFTQIFLLLHAAI